MTIKDKSIWCTTIIIFAINRLHTKDRIVLVKSTIQDHDQEQRMCARFKMLRLLNRKNVTLFIKWYKESGDTLPKLPLSNIELTELERIWVMFALNDHLDFISNHKLPVVHGYFIPMIYPPK